MNTQRYIIASIVKVTNYPDCSNNGLSNNFNNFYVPVEGGNYYHEEVILDSNIPVLEVGKAGDSIHLRPYNEDGKWFSFGGCFVYSSDSRFSKAFGRSPIHLHDRRE